MVLLLVARKIADVLERFLKICVILALTGIVVVVNIAVFFRYVLRLPLPWSGELAGYLLVFTVVFSSCIALRYKMFVSVEAVRDLLPAKVRNVLSVIIHLLVAGFLVVCAHSPEAMIMQAARARTVSPAMGIPMAGLYRVMQLGFVLMIFFVIISLVDQVLTGKGSANQAKGKV